MGKDELALHVEVAEGANETLKQGLIDSIKEIIKLRGDVIFKAPGELKNDGLVIEDARSYE